jgi:hypothetical protein
MAIPTKDQVEKWFPRFGSSLTTESDDTILSLVYFTKNEQMHYMDTACFQALEDDVDTEATELELIDEIEEYIEGSDFTGIGTVYLQISDSLVFAYFKRKFAHLKILIYQSGDFYIYNKNQHIPEHAENLPNWMY